MDDRSIVARVAWTRAAVGTALLVAPGSAVRAWTGRRPTAALKMAARVIGGRDLAIAVGTLGALRRGRDLKRWVAAGALADASDAFATAASRRYLRWPRAGALLTSSAGAAALQLRAARCL